MWLQKRRLTLVGETVGMTRLPKATEKAEPHRTEREFALLRDDRADSVFDTLIEALEEMPEALSGNTPAISSATSSAPAIQASHRRKLWRRWRCSAPGRSRYESSCRTSADQRQRPDSTRQLRSKPRSCCLLMKAAARITNPAKVRGSNARFRPLRGIRLRACDHLRADAQEGPGLGHLGVPFGQLVRRQEANKPLTGSGSNRLQLRDHIGPGQVWIGLAYLVDLFACVLERGMQFAFLIIGQT